mmetsp:Transcript_11103/g.24481  ORF Transcript_11103/g.24481 Transcript_11103/m.24481 type:complete len:495 (-) Transcript_11103:99-1583(-)
MLSGAKRKIGGHFGSAVGAASKRTKKSWRDEVSEDEAAGGEAGSSAAPLGGTANDSDSEEVLNPGTPLPSESEDEKAETAAAPDKEAEPTSVPTSATIATMEGQDSTPAAETSAAEAPAPSNAVKEGFTEADSSAPVGPPAIMTMELVVSGASRGLIKVMLPKGLDESLERRLSVCGPPDGGAVESLLKDSLCLFGSVDPKASAEAAKPGATAPEEADEEMPPEAPALNPSSFFLQQNGTSSSSTASPTSSIGGGELCCLLLGSKSLGLGITLLAADEHRVDRGCFVSLGTVVAGRGSLRKLAALSSLVPTKDGTALPATLRVVPPPEKAAGLGAGTAEAASTAVATSGPGLLPSSAGGDGPQEEDLIPHPFLLLTKPAPSMLNGGGKTARFVLDPDLHTAAAAEELEVAELELDCRESEVMELKEMTFSRERQAGVDNVEDRLQAIQERLKGLGEAGEVSKDDQSALSETLAGQRWWQTERLGRLLRVLSKLR